MFGGRRMNDNRAEQMEALEVLDGFNKRLLQNMPILERELSGKRVDDTDKFLHSIVDAINWEVQVMSSTMDLLDSSTKKIDKDEFNKRITELGTALKHGEDKEIATALEDLEPQFELLGKAAEEVLS
jgi:hypothetical protein